jgi:hypothetical protein
MAISFPETVRAGDTVLWSVDPTTDARGGAISSTEGWALTYYFRTNHTHEGATVEGVADGVGGWDLTLPAATTADFDAGRYFYQALATNGDLAQTIAGGTFEVLASLAYAGQPGAFDGRSQARIDLEQVQTAIRALISGNVQKYRIGERELTRIDLAELKERESQLMAQVAREELGRNVAGNLFVRFS